MNRFKPVFLILKPVSSKDSDSQPDIDLQVGEKRVRISVTPLEWIILAVTAISLAIILR